MNNTKQDDEELFVPLVLMITPEGKFMLGL